MTNMLDFFSQRFSKKKDLYPLDLRLFYDTVINLHDQLAWESDRKSIGGKGRKVGDVLSVEYRGGTMGTLISDGEEVRTSQGAVFNLLFNVIRNAARISVDADTVNLIISRGKDDLIFRVVDNGKGMAPELIDPTNEKNTFRGISYSGSTGIGLRNLPERLRALGATLAVTTRQRHETT